MNLLIDIGHPGHVHLYKNLYFELKSKGHELWVTVKDIPAAVQLLDLYEIPYIKFGKKGNGILAKALKQLLFNIEIFKLVKQKRIDIGLGTSISIAHVSRFSRMSSVVFDDDDDQVQPLFVYFGHPFCNFVVSPDALQGKRCKKSTIFYPGYHELAYLHPKRFIPDEKVLSEVGIKKGEKYFIMRFNAFKAHHDIGAHGLSLDNKRRLIDLLSPHGRVVITTEKDIEPEFKNYQLTVSPEKVHSLLYYATMFIGDSQTMTSEAAVLGTPALKCNSFAGRLAVPNELEQKYGLCYSFLPKDFNSLLGKMAELLKLPNLNEIWRQRQKRMLGDKIDVTGFMVWLIESYPQSFEIMKENPEYQKRFKSLK
jgi:uncharacterized protein